MASIAWRRACGVGLDSHFRCVVLSVRLRMHRLFSVRGGSKQDDVLLPAIAGELPVYLFPDSNSLADAPTELLHSIRKPVVLSTELLKSLVTTRNTFPDHPIQTKTSRRMAGSDE